MIELIIDCDCETSRWHRRRADAAERRLAEIQDGVRAYLATLRELASVRVRGTDAEHAEASARAADAYARLEELEG